MTRVWSVCLIVFTFSLCLVASNVAVSLLLSAAWRLGVFDHYSGFTELLRLLIPLVLAALAARYMSRHQSHDSHNSQRLARPNSWFARPFVTLALITYLFTWILGVPAVQTNNDQWVVAEYKRLLAEGSQSVSALHHPYFATRIALAASPCLVISYREYQIAGLYGCGEWQAHLWWPGGVYRLAHFPIWLS